MENKPNTGAAFRNNYKTEGDSKPDYKGTVDVDGQAKEIALWLRTSKESGVEYLSVKISDPYQKEQPPEAIPPKLDQQPEPPETDDLPFIITILLAVGGLFPYLF